MYYNNEDIIQDSTQAWADVKESKKMGHVLFGRVIGIETLENGKVKEECLKINFNGIYGYLPRTLIDRYEFKGLQHFLGGEFEFIVDEYFIDEQIFLANRIKALDKSAKIFWNKVRKGIEVEAFVRGADQFNVYCLVNGVSTKLHRDDFSYTYFEDIREAVEICDTFPVIVDEFVKPGEKDEDGNVITEGRIKVSKKALETDPMTFINEYKEKSYYLGRITKIHPQHGLFVELEPRGIVSRCNFPPHYDGKPLRVGDEVNVKIQEIIVKERKVKGLIILPKSLKSRAERPIGRAGVSRRSII